jgi:hypothetical protein
MLLNLGARLTPLIAYRDENPKARLTPLKWPLETNLRRLGLDVGPDVRRPHEQHIFEGFIFTGGRYLNFTGGRYLNGKAIFTQWRRHFTRRLGLTLAQAKAIALDYGIVLVKPRGN